MCDVLNHQQANHTVTTSNVASEYNTMNIMQLYQKCLVWDSAQANAS
jgi:L,D-peptidoglycan transpeptidase YkuD (ErfK/YbiS/YcfS/YnhG family)